MKALFVVVCVFALAVWAVAQGQPGDWQGLGRLRPGERIEVVQTNMVRHSGSFVTVNDDFITLRVDDNERSVARGQVARVSTSRPMVRGLTALALGTAGGLFGAAIAHTTAAHSHGIGVDIAGAAVGATLGAVGGAFVVPRKTLYRPHP